jgi:hypothetical protein
VNTFHFVTAGLLAPTPADLDNIVAALTSFYTAIQSGGNKMTTYFSSMLASGAVHTIKIYDVAGPPPHEPIRTAALNLNMSPTFQPLPSEVAVCLSYRANLVSGQNPRRSRGRVYLGPLGQNAVGTTPSASDVRPVQGLMDTWLQAGTALRDDAGTTWVIYSRIGLTSLPIAQVSVDDAFDTQRRRGGRPTVKQVG